ncbi:MAG: Veg family protein [Coriobacteriia bacterium]|nr:Veg family protein [Coriobacteriia bacterium]
MESMQQPVQTIGHIREMLEDRQGETVKVRANMGRSKVVEREGMILQCYPSLFVIEVFEKRSRRGRVSYQYVDILTGSVELIATQTEEPIFPWITFTG